MITIYPPDCTDFSTNGLGILAPYECKVKEIAGGMYELTLEHPIDDTLRWAQITNGCIIKAPVPMREGPLYEIEAMEGVEETTKQVTRQVYTVTTSTGVRLNLRKGPSLDAKILGSYKPGTQVIKLGASGSWTKVSIRKGGAVGYMWSSNLINPTTITETVNAIQPVTREGVRIEPAREQQFRVVSVEQDTANGVLRAQAMQRFYDLRGNVIDGDYAPENVAAKDAVEYIGGHLLNATDFSFYAPNLDTKISGDYGYKSPVEALLDPDEGIAAQANAMVVRDGFDVYLLPDQPRDMGVTIRRGKNLIGVTVTTDFTDVVTLIIPVGKNKKGDDLYLTGTKYVDSPRINDYPVIYAKRIEYDVRVVDKNPDGEKTFANDAAARAKLAALAQADFDNGVDLPSYSMEVDFEQMSQAEGYEDYAELQAIHLYDTVTVIDTVIGLKAKVRATGYEWDALAKRYTSMTLGDLQDVTQTVYSYNLPTGGVSGTKIANNSMPGAALRNLSLDYAKIAVAAIQQLTADTLFAVQANIQQLTAGRITTDELYASMAQIVSAQIGEADVDHAAIKALAAQVAEIAEAQIEHADIGTAVIDDAYISTLAAALATIARASIEHADIDDALIDWAGIDNLTAQAAAIAKANVGSVTIASANIDWAAVAALAADVADISQARIDQAEISQATIERVTAEVTDTITLTAQNANFDFASAQRLVASAMILEQGVGGSVTIENLVATSAMLVQATLGKLTLKGDDGKYYDVTVAADGTIHTEDTGYTDADIIDGVAPNGRPVVATEAAIDELNSTNIRAQSAIMTQIFTKALTAETISASEAFLASATIPQLYVTAIAALGDTLDLRANSTIRLAVGDAIVSRQRWYQLQPAGQAAPAKPAVNPPGGAWTDEEPAFESGSRNKFGPNESPAEGAYIDATGAVVGGWTDVSGGDGAVLTAEVGAETAGQYRCIVTDANGDAVTTETASLAVGTKALPLITAQPENAFAARNSTVELTVEAENVASYQWQWKAIDSETWADLSAGNTSYPGGTTKTVSFELTPQRAAASRHYRCVLTNSAGSVITDVVAATIDTGENVYIAAQPANFCGDIGDTATFTVDARNVNDYRWQRSDDQGETWANLSTNGAYTDTYYQTISAERATWLYRCRMRNGEEAYTYTEAVAMVIADGVAVTTQPTDQTGETGDTVAFTVAAAGAEPLTYQWQFLCDWTASDYIAVEPGTEYYFQPNTTAGGTAKHAFYDEGLDFISAVASGPGAFTTPEGCRFMRFSYRSASDDIQLETGDAPTDWEPYDPERRYVLYFVDLSEYAGGTWEYGDVCVSSGYEAAKAADSAQSAADDNAAGIDTLNGELQAVQDAADAAMGAVRSLAVGGVNLIDDSARITITGTDDPATSYLELAGGLLPGTVYTLGMASAVLAAGSAAGMTLEAVRQSDGEILFTDTLDFSGGHQKHTFATGEGDATYALRLYAGIKGASNGVTVELEKVKLEQGTFATMWTESPADAEQKLAALTSQLNLTQGGLEDIVTHVTQDVDGTIRSVNSYFRFDGTDPNNPKLIIGSSVSPMTMELTNSRLSFLWNGDPVAYFSDNKLYVTNVEAIERMSVGTPQNGYMDIVTTATGVGFMWRS